MLTHGNSNLERTLEIRHYSDFGNSNLAISPTSSVSALDWHHLVFTASQGEGVVRFYVDGQLMDEDTSSDELSPVDYNGNDLFIGAEPNLAGKWGGHLDELGIWSRALSASEVTSLFNTPSPIQGCTDETACDFNQDANVDDGSCIPSGCLDTDACNFNSEAECEGEACDYSCCPGPGCCSVGHYWDWELEQCFDINPTDTNLDGCTDLNDLMDILSAYGGCGAVETPWQCDEPLGYQGYDYATVSIGEQCWFAENLRTEQYSNGDPIPMIFENSEWLDTSEGARCWINNDSTYFGFPGFLYNGYVVDDSRGVCPQLWHVADDAEWIELEISHGLSEIEAHETGVRGVSIQLSQKMRVDVWGGINVLGFSAVRGGYRNWENGSFSGGIDSGAYWSNGSDLDGPGYREFHGPWDGVARDDIGISEGLSIRCIKD